MTEEERTVSVQQVASRVGWGVLAAYLVIAFGVHHAFPFYIFDMYSMPAAESVAPLAVRDARGEVSEIRTHEGWRCATPTLPSFAATTAQCGTIQTVEARDKDDLNWIAWHSGNGGQPVEIIRRIWRIHDGAAVSRDCAIARCEVTR